jgi:hypothetical protein
MILLTLWSLGTMLPDLYRMAGPLKAIGLSADNNGLVLDVRHPFASTAGSPAARAGILPGDRLDLRRMQCRDPFGAGCTAVTAVLGDFGGVEYTMRAGPITLSILPKAGGPPRAVTVTAVPAPLAWHASLLLLADTAVGALFVSVAFLLVWTRPSRMTWGFFLYAIWFNPGQNYTFYALLQLWPPAVIIEQWLEAFIQGAAYAGLIAFALRFPEETPEPRWRWLNAALPWLAAMITALTLLSGANLFGWRTETVTAIQLLMIVPLDVLAIVLLVLRLRHLPPQDEARMRWVIAGCAIGLPAFLAAELCQSSNLPEALLGVTPPLTVIEVLFLCQGVIAYFVGTAVRRRRVVSVAIPLRRGGILAALTFILGVPIVYLHDQVSLYGGNLNERFHLPEWIWLAVISPMALIALTQLHHHSVEFIERLFNRRYHRARSQFEHCGRSMLTLTSFEEVDRLLTERPIELLHLSSAAVFRRIDGTFRRCGPAPGWAAADLTVLDPALDALPLLCLKTGRPQPLLRGSWYRPGLPPDDQMPCLAVPVRGGVTESLAMALLGPHVTGSDINADEQSLLRDFAEQAAFGYDRVEVEFLRREIEALRRDAARNNRQITI